jgi:tetratricopeptide (TPR) repeat protein
MDLKKHLDRAEEALRRGQADFAAELCDQVLDFAPGEARAAALLTEALIQLGEGKKSLFGKLGAGPAGMAAGLSKLTRNAEGEARARRRAFIKNPSSLDKGFAWADALERAGYAGAALGAFGALAERHGEAAKRAGGLAAAQGEVDAALAFYQKALDANPRDTEAMRARKNLAAEQALQTKKYEEAESGFDLAVDPQAFLRAARGEEDPEGGA